ncbi:MAG: HAMP domain-containing sensor histidine kinase [Lachnospira sp.]|nr:HAMP domain-containing sensor histidine kinase [Lachnospira sp.]
MNHVDMSRKIKKENLHGFTEKAIPQVVIQSAVIVLSAFASNMFMTWIVTDVARVQDTYQGAAYESLGTLVLTICIIVPINTIAYRRRLREVVTLSEHIQRVADGDYRTRIPINPKDQILPVYENFNKMCAELQSVEILRNDFINNYSHEFKTPIASINGFASLLLEKECTKEQEKEYLEIIKDESERLSNLAKNTILLSKVSSQQMITDMEQYNLGEQLRQCAIILSPQWLAKKITFSGEFPDIFFEGNKELMQHLWLNIMGNAVKYTPEGGTITAELTKENHNIVVTVSDTGEGMSEETMKHLFEPYFQGDTSHSGKGLGLGMAISKRIVELCYGKIRVESQEDIGSQFIVELPVK